MPPAALGTETACPLPEVERSRRIGRWQDRLKHMAEWLLPTDYPRPLPMKVVEADKTLSLPDPICLRLLQLSLSLTQGATNHVTPFTLVLSAFAVLIHRWTGEEDMVVVSSSNSSVLTRNPMLLRLPVQSITTFQELVQLVQQVEEEAEKDNVPFDELLEALTEANFPNVLSLTRIRFFNLIDTNATTLSTSSTSSDITIFISQTPTARRLLPVEIRIVYNSVLFSEERIDEMFDQITHILDSVTQDPSKQVGDISLVTKNALTNLVLPDPARQLVDWATEWPGAIHRIFMKNAATHPDRPCVFETVKFGGERRVFTYAQIDGASSLLAQALIRGGINVEDVVIIYAYRAVELVVAIMAVLKAGATFSVIDPQYPPNRQKIYLSVARPAGLIVLGRAGDLIDEVQDYIQSGQDFNLKCLIPHLTLSNDGGLKCQSSDKKLNLLDQVLQDHPEPSYWHAHLPEIGPDQIGTLSFTSGSTGIPKGVRGRHFSLTHFYPWMATEFGITRNEQFTMLSGIAHDPIQRDIFTPLFFGAQVHIPTAEDIGTPGRLAQWMAENKCSVTHLTPAMGQLLSANATAMIPSLRLAFFVGDILTKRDVTRLQQLASNCTVINMYGTTETQRAVSFYRIDPDARLDSEKDVFPAGHGMRGVQLLVINSRGKPCGVGEVGEIYVRSYGLAEGYLRNEAETQKKFVGNFLLSPPVVLPSANVLGHPRNFGPRDRMYKTGDLGRYRPDGVVECSGRADDQVKIRGFRIELGEIDTHLSQHPGVRENVTLVRRDAYEEKTLVAYFVPQPQSVWDGLKLEDETTVLKDLAGLIQHIREYLRKKLPSYSVPSVFAPLIRMPLTPNGKVDKNALPYPDTVVSSTTENAPSVTMSPLETHLVRIWSETLFPPRAPSGAPARTIGLDENFFDLGGHSILATRLVFQARKQLKVQADAVPLNLLFRCPTVRQMAAEIEQFVNFGVAEDTSRANESSTDRTYSPLLHAQPVEQGSEDVDLSEYIQLDDSIRPRLGQTLVFQAEGRQGFDPGSFEPKAIFLTGATGFLGAFILNDLLRTFSKCTVYCLVRAKTEEDGWKRLERNMEIHLLWKAPARPDDIENMRSRTRVVLGDLAKPWLGIGSSAGNETAPAKFLELADTVDCVVHNGALVHWVYPLSKLKPANVDGTVEALKLCVLGKYLKPFHFVSSTSVLDTAHYTQQKLTSVLESDDLEGSRRGLKSGYGQSKWVAEKILSLASTRAAHGNDGPCIPITVIRPGYILGDSRTGVTNTDDFIWRLCKGCLELGQVPIMTNVVNAVPVDYCAKVVSCVVYRGAAACRRSVYHVWNPQRVRFIDLWEAMAEFGQPANGTQTQQGAWHLEFRPYVAWRDALSERTLATDDHALYPLLHFVLDDLPTSTQSPSLDWRNTRWALEGSGVTCQRLVSRHVAGKPRTPSPRRHVLNKSTAQPSSSSLMTATSDGGRTEEEDSENEHEDGRRPLMERYLQYLCTVGFLPWPAGRQPSEEMRDLAMISRSGH